MFMNIPDGKFTFVAEELFDSNGLQYLDYFIACKLSSVCGINRIFRMILSLLVC